MRVIHATRDLKSPTEMNGKLGKTNLRFSVMFEPGKDTEVQDAEYDELLKEEVFEFLLDEGLLKEINAKQKKSSLEIAKEDLVKAEESLNLAKDDAEKKAASENLKKAKTAFKKAEKASKK